VPLAPTKASLSEIVRITYSDVVPTYQVGVKRARRSTELARSSSAGGVAKDRDNDGASATRIACAYERAACFYFGWK
jgi:hypothetical protein